MNRAIRTLLAFTVVFIVVVVAAATPLHGLASSAFRTSLTPSAPTVALPWLKTMNGQIVRVDNNQRVELRGVNVLRNEWVYPSMAYERLAIPHLANVWHANLITHGFASEPVVNNDATYLGVLDEYQQLAEQNNMYIIFAYYYPTLNGYQPPNPDVDPNAQQALVNLVQRYRNESNVMFMLQAEPHSDWWNGQYYQVTWNNLRPTYDQMITAMRAVDNPTPTKHLILAAGDGWGRDISPVVTDNDPITADGAENIVYSSHPYDHYYDTNDWEYFLPVADAGYPVLVTEFGTGGQMDQTDTERLMTLMNNGTRHISWTSWIFDNEGCPCLLTGTRTNFTPGNPYGVSVRDRILAEATIFGGGSPTTTPTLTSPTSTRTPTSQPTPTATRTPTSQFTFTATRTPTSQSTSTPTRTRTNTSTPAPPTSTNTPVPPTQTDTPVPPTDTRTSTLTRTATFTRTATSTRTVTNTPLATQTPGGPTATPTETPSDTPTDTPTETDTPTYTSTAIPPTNTRTRTRTNTNTPAPTGTGTPPPTDTRTRTRTNTPAPTGTGTLVPTDTRTLTTTNTPAPVGTGTPMPTHTDTPAPTDTRTPLPTQTPGGPTATPTSESCTMSFSDVHEGDYFYAAVEYLFCDGAISGYEDGTFRPYNNTTRGQLCKIIVLAEGWPIDTTGGPHFTDVPTSNVFYEYVETAYNHAIIVGYADGTFRPGNNVTRGQLCKIIVLAQGWPVFTEGGPHFTDVPANHPFYDHVETAYSRTIVGGYADGTFRPGNNATRGQICKIVYNAVVGP